MSQTPPVDQQHRTILTFSAAASAELQSIQAPAAANVSGADAPPIRDLTGLLGGSM